MKNTNGFTLVELLVVVLIIGILSSIALPQYQKAVERGKMTEAVVVLRAIANANQLFRMQNGRYANADEIESLNVDIPGKLSKQIQNDTRVATKNFIYSPTGSGLPYLAIAQRADDGVWRGTTTGYYLYIHQTDPSRIKCSAYSQTPPLEKELCTQLNAEGLL
jgi:prepilin-type N-terminal cleavage/methylation domain-containing protein